MVKRKSVEGRKAGILLIFICVLVALNAQAQDSEVMESSYPLAAGLRLELRDDDNIFRTNANELDSRITILSPGILATLRPSRHRIEFAYKGEYAWYSESSPDDYDDHQVRAGAYLKLGGRSQLDFVGTYIDSHQDRGTGLTAGFDPQSVFFPEEPDEYQDRQYISRFSYGGEGSRGRLVFEVGKTEFEFTNRRDRTIFFDRDGLFGNATFFYRVMPRTSLLFDVRTTEINYQIVRPGEPSRDSNEYRYLLGATWDVVGKTTGTVKVGYIRKSYENSSRDDFSGASWEVNIRWSPRSYSHIDLASTKRPLEITAVTGDFIDHTTFSVAWTHEWSGRVESRLAALYSDDDYRGSISNRKQELNSYRATLAYKMRRWLSWDIGVDATSRDSNIEQLNFDGIIVRLGVNLVWGKL